ncbi:MAG: T9SS type A sorting domain-containing protein [Bacteroidia bacterium]|nr:T9SS type A sorting domain-containing protein [Bacteroidia bacterium]
MKINYSKILATAIVFRFFSANAEEITPKQSISFKENKGQVCDQNYNPRPDVLFSGIANGLNFHLTNHGLSYQVQNVIKWRDMQVEGSKEKIKSPEITSIYRVDISWLNSNPNTVIEKSDQLDGKDNYYLQQCPNGALNVRSFGEIKYKDIYNGIDLKWYSKNSELEYDFIVKPFADYSQIQFEIKGAQRLSINNRGELIIETPFGEIVEKAPKTYQGNKIIPSQWKLNGNKLCFVLGDYNKSMPVTIDPAVRVWGTYYGGSLNEFGRGCKNDASGNVYLSGYSASATTTLIATVGSFQSTYAGGAFDSYLAKFNSTGVRQWGTYFGGASDDFGLGLTVDGTNSYITGYSNSTATVLATAAAHQTVNAGGHDAFLAKFDQNGVRLWSTFYGGGSTDVGFACTKDASGNVYIAGYTSSASGLSSAGAHQVANGGGGNDAFLAKFNSAGVRQWGTFYGGGSIDFGYTCAVDATGRVYLAGRVGGGAAAGAISTPGSHQVNWGGSAAFYDAYLVQFNSAGVRQWGTYYGGGQEDVAHSCITDAAGDVYMFGESSSAGGTVIATASSQQATLAGVSDAFLVKFNPAGVRQWGTFYGGTGDEYGNECVLNTNGNILVVGTTGSTNGIAINMPHQSISGGGAYDAFIANYNSTTGALDWGTYYGGAGNDYGMSCSSFNSSFIYIAGYTDGSSTGTTIATAASQQSVASGANDGFLVHLFDCPNITGSVVGTTTICTGQTTTLTYNGTGFTTYTWMPGNINTSTISLTPFASSNYTVSASTATAACKNYSTAFSVIVNLTPVISISPSSATVCSGSSKTLTAFGATTFTWSNASTTASTVVSPTTQTTYTVNGTSVGCIGTKTIAIAVTPLPTLTVTAGSASLCSGETTTLTVAGATTYTWDNAATTTTILVTPSVSTTYSVVGTASLCSSTETIVVGVTPTPTLNVSSSASAICTGGSATLTANGASTYSWISISTGSNITVSPTVATTYTAIGYNASCSDTTTLNIGISTSITVNAVANPTSICTGENATITASGASTYTWNSGANSIAIVVSPTLAASTIYTVNGESGSCAGSSTVALVVNACVGIKEIEGLNSIITVFPNPTNGIIIIETEDISYLKITNVLGQTISESKLEKGTNTITLNEVASGVYYFTFKQGEIKTTKKIVKN